MENKKIFSYFSSDFMIYFKLIHIYNFNYYRRSNDILALVYTFRNNNRVF